MNIDFIEVMKRCDIQHLRAFLLTGKECENPNDDSYRKRLEEPQRIVIHMIEKKFPEMDDSECLSQKIYDAVGTCMDVFMEIGIQAGMKLAQMLLAQPKDT